MKIKKYRYYLYNDTVYKVDSELNWKLKSIGGEFFPPPERKNKWTKIDSKMCTQISEAEAFELML